MKKETRVLISNVGKYWSSLLVANTLFCPFCLPLAAWLIVCQCYSSILLNFDSPLDSWFIVTFVGLLPTLELFFVGLAGLNRCHKDILWDESGPTAKNFFAAVKRQFGRHLLYGALFWLSLTLAVVGTAAYLSFDLPGVLVGFGVGVCLLQALFVLPSVLTCVAETVFFSDKLSDVLANAFRLTALRPSLVLHAAIAALPVVVATLLPLVAQISVWILFIFVISTFSVTYFLAASKRAFDFVVKARYR